MLWERWAQAQVQPIAVMKFLFLLVDRFEHEHVTEFWPMRAGGLQERSSFVIKKR